MITLRIPSRPLDLFVIVDAADLQSLQDGNAWGFPIWIDKAFPDAPLRWRSSSRHAKAIHIGYTHNTAALKHLLKSVQLDSPEDLDMVLASVKEAV